jgi:phytoene dehydrogenase-like protein
MSKTVARAPGKSMIVIGAGIAGLSAGCYAQMNGYRSRIYEMHTRPSGLCTAWQRKGYTIDYCIHWLTGSKPGGSMYRLWEEIGLVQGLELVDLDELYRYEGADRRVVVVYRDLERTEAHLRELSPADAPRPARATLARPRRRFRPRRAGDIEGNGAAVDGAAHDAPVGRPSRRGRDHGDS